ncbi:helix-turn-helix domain-containing protein [Streptomyces sp. NPDC048337]|uniref:helix-turn-helix domain-containing protein n=1 Tax=Streptomyces sp. NPDC048337 TaxID=3365535 RepID=UPI0037149DDD
MSPAAVPAGDGFEWFTDTSARAPAPAPLGSGGPNALRAEAAVVNLGESVRLSALRRQGDPGQCPLGLVPGSPLWIARHRDGSGPVTGDVITMLWDTTHPSEEGMLRAVVLQIPTAVLPLPADKVDRLLARRIPADRGSGAILGQFIASLAVHAADCGPLELARLGGVAVDLVTACLAAHADAYEELPGEVADQALRARIGSFIEHNLGSTELTPQTIAARHHISLRRLHLLFQGQAESVAASIRRRRLERCRADLSRPELLSRPIHAIAAHWGFTNPAVFSRAFREAYGISPKELRVRAAQTSCTHDQQNLRALHRQRSGPAIGSG